MNLLLNKPTHCYFNNGKVVKQRKKRVEFYHEIGIYILNLTMDFTVEYECVFCV